MILLVPLLALHQTLQMRLTLMPIRVQKLHLRQTLVDLIVTRLMPPTKAMAPMLLTRARTLVRAKAPEPVCLLVLELD